MWPVPSAWATWKRSSGAVLCQVGFQIKGADGLDWGLSLGGVAPGFTPWLAPHRARQPSHLAFVCPPPWGWMGTLAKWELNGEEPPGDRAPVGSSMEPASPDATPKALPRPQPSGPAGGIPAQDWGFLPSPSGGDVGLPGPRPSLVSPQPPCMRPKPFPFVISLLKKKKK